MYVVDTKHASEKKTYANKIIGFVYCIDLIYYKGHSISFAPYFFLSQKLPKTGEIWRALFFNLPPFNNIVSGRSARCHGCNQCLKWRLMAKRVTDRELS
jgi:hypothetical protein